MLAQDDWANSGWRYFKCIQSLGIDILALKGSFHRMAYPEQIPIHPCMMNKSTSEYPLNIPELGAYAKDAKVIHYIASKVILPGIYLMEKKVVMQHGGSIYRTNHEKINDFCNNFASASIIQCPDLLGLGAKNEHWIYYPVDTDFIQPDFTTKDKLIVGHFPSNPEIKGTSTIVKIIEKLEKSPLSKRFEYIGNRHTDWSKEFIKEELVLWTDNLRRLAKCDIIIETCNDNIEGNVYGEWGNTAIEAAALGKIVITNSLAQDLYKKEYGGCALQIANTPKELEETLTKILSLSNAEIELLKAKSRHWVEDKHSIPATAQKLWDKVYKDLL
jgi:hypothetical protein